MSNPSNYDYGIKLKDVSVSFGGAPVLEGVNLNFAKGRVTALVGPNGAGKTTVFNLICGLARPDRGQIFYRGQDITGRPPWEITRLGIGRTFQDMLLFEQMTVMQNVVVVLENVAEQDGRRSRLFKSIFPQLSAQDPGRVAEQAGEALRQVGLEGKADDPAYCLSVGEQKLLSLARLLISKPDVLLLDEPIAWVHTGMVEVVLTTIREQAAKGKTVVVIEHDSRFLDALTGADYFYKMADGRVTDEGAPGAGERPMARSASA